MQASEVSIVVFVAATLGGASIIMRLVRAYGEEIIEFAKWLREFIETLRRLRGS